MFRLQKGEIIVGKIKLSRSTYTVIPEGSHVFRIDEVEYDEDFGKITVSMVTASGAKHNELFSLIKNDGEANEGALNAFSYFAKTALNDFNTEEIDPSELVGCFIECVVTHDVRPHKSGDGRTVTFVRLGDKYPSSGFGKPEKAPMPSETPKKVESKTPFDLDSILGK